MVCLSKTGVGFGFLSFAPGFAPGAFFSRQKKGTQQQEHNIQVSIFFSYQKDRPDLIRNEAHRYQLDLWASLFIEQEIKRIASIIEYKPIARV